MTGDGELALADIAAGQWGLVTTPQAVVVGLSRVQLSRLCKAGALIRLLHGVYALRGAMGTENIELRAAWLALDPRRLATDRLGDGPHGLVVSHASAAAFRGLGDLDADRHEFTAPSRKQTRRDDLRLHRGVLAADEVTVYRGLPVTTPLRTVVDLLADGHDGGHVAGVVADALRLRMLNPDELAGRIGHFAPRFGLPRGDGNALMRHLEELGGVSEQVDADKVAEIARAARLPVSAILDALSETRAGHARLAQQAIDLQAAANLLEVAGVSSAIEKLAAAAVPKVDPTNLLGPATYESLATALSNPELQKTVNMSAVAQGTLAAVGPKLSASEISGISAIVEQALASHTAGISSAARRALAGIRQSPGVESQDNDQQDDDHEGDE
ncbi:hypothetical protein GCM10009836_37470 [Pseudonocardia ailaonensis]|uniref:AbiEi antitoxin N-terminal domain-containing protein n=1 Tax=Pseudonocardia ailaonensis TaxID=367279 RepID=A0ABN2N5T0_9PSEU